MTTRKALLRAMVEGYFGPGPVPHDALDEVRPGLLAALDAVEPIIRADERERRAAPYQAALTQQLQDWADLRAKVDALRDQAQRKAEDDSLSQPDQNVWKVKALAYARVVGLLDGEEI